MELNDINRILSQLADDKANGRNHILTLAAALIEWMGLQFVENSVPRLLDFQTLKLKEALVGAPVTGQEQLYRLTAENQPVRVRFAVFKKYDKKMIHYLVDGNVGLASYQAAMRGIKQIEGREPYVARQPYFIHFIATAKYDRLWVVFNDGEQKRVLVFRNRLTQTQNNKIMPAWHNIAAKSKPEMAKLFWSSLDVKEVNKDFYQHIKERFDALIAIAKTQEKHFAENAVKQFAVRLIGRYIFCWFLKEKEIIPEALIASKTIEKYRNIYFQQCLAKLFFNTLNAEVTDHARNLAINDELDVLYKNIPYLNGGLFDWHPEDELFNKLDLNDWLIAFVKKLEEFDFTVDESSSQYQQIAIDPEMLGRIFENLLASQNPDTEKMANQRKAFGAFYTPREIVDYMVNESLKAYLENQLLPQLPEQVNVVRESQAAYNDLLFQHFETPKPIPIDIDKSKNADIERRRERIKTKIDKLFVPDCADNPFDKEETVQARKALSKITILDPACGSGAFPMGVMLRLMELRQVIGHGQRNSYDLKEEILSKNIFGVDIMPMAVEIARLRAWLSLVLEADYKPADRKNNFGVAALPNLDFKFICANSLIDSGYDDFLSKLQYNLTFFRLDGEIQKLEAMRENYFDPKGDKNRKKELQKEFLKTKEYIKTEFVSLKKSWNLGDFLDKVDDWNPFDDSHPSSFFSPAWMFGVRNGFDVVIGNPPYVQIQNFSGKQEQKDWEKQKFATYVKTGDVYCLFYERGYQLLRSGGALTFITSNKWMRANYGKAMRKYIAANGSILQLIDFGDSPIFENATTYTNILIWEKTTECAKTKAWDLTGKAYANDTTLDKLLEKQGECDALFNEDSFVIVNSDQTAIKKRIEAVGTPLKDWDISINYGIKTGLNEAFIIDGRKKDELIAQDPKSAEILKPILRGRDIKRYKAEFADLWLINSHTGYFDKNGNHIPKINIKKDYKAIWSYLDNFNLTSNGQVEKRTDQGEHWSNLRNCAYLEEVEKDKILYAEIVYDAAFYFDSNSYYPEATTFIMTGERLKYLTALLNSKMITYAFKKFYAGGDLRGNTFRYKKVFVELLPIPKIPHIQQLPFEILVDCILFCKERNMDSESSLLESVVDGLVYDLYFPAEMKSAHCYITDRIAEVLKPFNASDTIAFKKEYITELCKFFQSDTTVYHGLIHRRTIKEIQIITGDKS